MVDGRHLGETIDIFNVHSICCHYNAEYRREIFLILYFLYYFGATYLKVKKNKTNHHFFKLKLPGNLEMKLQIILKIKGQSHEY